MLRPPNLSPIPGTFALLNKKERVAYVGYGKNLRSRFDTWEYHFRRASEDSSYTLPARDMPRSSPNDWEFLFLAGDHEEHLRLLCREKGLRVLNSHSRKRTTYLVDGIRDSLIGHCRRLGIDHNVVYKRVERGQTPEQAMRLTEAPMFEPRDFAIQNMRTKIVDDLAGDGTRYLTYDEALQKRPEIGDVRTKLAKLRKANPELSEIKLTDIPTS